MWGDKIEYLVGQNSYPSPKKKAGGSNRFVKSFAYLAEDQERELWRIEIQRGFPSNVIVGKPFDPTKVFHITHLPLFFRQLNNIWQEFLLDPDKEKSLGQDCSNVEGRELFHRDLVRSRFFSRTKKWWVHVDGLEILAINCQIQIQNIIRLLVSIISRTQHVNNRYPSKPLDLFHDNIDISKKIHTLIQESLVQARLASRWGE